MNNKNIWIGLVVVALIAIGSYQFPKVQTVIKELGANPGPTFLNPLEFEGGVTYGNVNSTSTPASLTIVVGDVLGFDTVIVRPTGVNSAKTLTFFASSTASHWLPRAGDTQRTCFLNATTTAATTLIFAGGTGIDLQNASSSANTDLTISADGTACFTFIRKAQIAGVTNSFDIEANMTEYFDAD